jgi:DNA-binding NarL/FixJ family response regulator
MGRIRVVLADDHSAMLNGIADFLATEFEVVGMAADGRQAIEAVKNLDPDVLVIDITMPKMSGIEVVRRLKEAGTDLSVVFLTVHDDPEFAKEALEVGAQGYVIKPRMSSDLVVAVKEAYAGRSFVSAPVLSAMNS